MTMHFVKKHRHVNFHVNSRKSVNSVWPLLCSSTVKIFNRLLKVNLLQHFLTMLCSCRVLPGYAGGSI